MKCKNCGASVPSRLPACEYCGTVNEVYIKRKQEMEFLLNIFNSEKRRALMEAAPDIAVRVLNKFIIVAVIILVVALSASFAVFSLNHGISRDIPVGNEQEHLQVLEKMHKEKRFDEIGGYLYQNNLYSDKYLVYQQANAINEDMSFFWSSVKYFEDIFKEIEGEEDPPYSAEEDAIRKYTDILSWAYDVFNFIKEDGIYSYQDELLLENKDFYQECVMEVTACLKYRCGLTDEGIKTLREFSNRCSDEFIEYCNELYDKYLSQRESN
jgi:hypothetical protein